MSKHIIDKNTQQDSNSKRFKDKVGQSKPGKMFYSWEEFQTLPLIQQITQLDKQSELERIRKGRTKKIEFHPFDVWHQWSGSESYAMRAVSTRSPENPLRYQSTQGEVPGSLGYFLLEINMAQELRTQVPVYLARGIEFDVPIEIDSGGNASLFDGHYPSFSDSFAQASRFTRKYSTITDPHRVRRDDDEKEAKHFMERFRMDGSDVCCVWLVEIPAGTPMSYLGGPEREYVLPRNSKLTLVHSFLIPGNSNLVSDVNATYQGIKAVMSFQRSQNDLSPDQILADVYSAQPKIRLKCFASTSLDEYDILWERSALLQSLHMGWLNVYECNLCRCVDDNNWGTYKHTQLMQIDPILYGCDVHGSVRTMKLTFRDLLDYQAILDEFPYTNPKHEGTRMSDLKAKLKVEECKDLGNMFVQLSSKLLHGNHFFLRAYDLLRLLLVEDLWQVLCAQCTGQQPYHNRFLTNKFQAFTRPTFDEDEDEDPEASEIMPSDYIELMSKLRRQASSIDVDDQ